LDRLTILFSLQAGQAAHEVDRDPQGVGLLQNAPRGRQLDAVRLGVEQLAEGIGGSVGQARQPPHDLGKDLVA
jgi:hypothetical protein